jgi:heme/copper-type cytochrome/quinol oxidase subunit 2
MDLSFADGLFWASVACCALAQLFILRSVGSSARGASGAAPLRAGRGAMELIWAALPALGLAVLLVFTWRAMRAPAPDAPIPAAPAARGAGTTR